jgi:hypothetical protein
MPRYAKIFDLIWQGSLRGQSDALLVFINLLTHANEEGIVNITPKVIEDETGLPANRVKSSLVLLQSEDNQSKSPDENGRRIKLLDEHRTWGWKIVNHKTYRELCTKGQNAERQKRFRQSNAVVTPTPVGVGVGVDASKEGDARGNAGLRVVSSDELNFETFWKAYPRKEGKGYAIKCWIKAQEKPDIATIIEAVKRDKKKPQWTKDGGQFIPMPSTWINQSRWLDAASTETTKPAAQAGYVFRDE